MIAAAVRKYKLLPALGNSCSPCGNESSRHVPRTKLPSLSSLSMNPGGQYTKDSVVRRKLWSAIAAFV